MLKQVLKVVLLVALLATLVISSAPTLASGGCSFDKKTGQCIDKGCHGTCFPGLFSCSCAKGF